MPKFRKKPIVIEAHQFRPEKGIWPMGVFANSTTNDGPVVSTLEGQLRVSPGDWIITDAKGERYPCKPDIFEATYEKV